MALQAAEAEAAVPVVALILQALLMVINTQVELAVVLELEVKLVQQAALRLIIVM